MLAHEPRASTSASGMTRMLGPAEIIRAARLAVARYGAEAVRVQNVLQAVLTAQAHGEGADLFDALVDDNLLTARQANDLRSGLDQTQVDPDTDVKSKEKPARTTQRPPAGSNGQAVPEALGQLPQVAGFKI